MTFFPHLHEPGRSSVLDRSVEHPVFEAFYRAHIAKLLLARGADRYVSKANYNITRLAYLQRMFPEARFVLPIRKPESHIGSLMRQHKRFTEGLATNPKGREHLRRIGHFEFGPDRRPVCVGRSNTTAEIADLWSRGEEIAGWARYWAMVYGFVADQLDRDSQLRDAVLVLRYEDLCSDPARALAELFAHVKLDAPTSLVEDYQDQLSAPTYYDVPLSDRQAQTIWDETCRTRVRFGFTTA